MKRLFWIAITIVGLLFTNNLEAQDSTAHKKKRTTFSGSKDGIHIIDSAKRVADSVKPKRFTFNLVMMDLGINVLQDLTNYNDPRVLNYLNVPANKQNESLFNLRQGKSINVNIYPWMVRFRALETKGQKIFITSGIGLQLYNFRYEQPLTYTKGAGGVGLDTLSFKKDKVGLDYLNVPLMFTFKTRLYNHKWLVYGAGITGGYRIASWTKQVLESGKKVKVHDPFAFADFNSCVTAEIGFESGLRFYATYQLTNLYNNGLEQHPFSFGFKLIGL